MRMKMFEFFQVAAMAALILVRNMLKPEFLIGF